MSEHQPGPCWGPGVNRQWNSHWHILRLKLWGSGWKQYDLWRSKEISQLRFPSEKTGLKKQGNHSMWSPKVQAQGILGPRCSSWDDPMDCSTPGSSVCGILRQEYWSGLPFPSPGDLPNPGIEPRSPTVQADSLPSEPQGNWAVKPVSWDSPYSVFWTGILIFKLKSLDVN